MPLWVRRRMTIRFTFVFLLQRANLGESFTMPKQGISAFQGQNFSMKRRFSMFFCRGYDGIV
jgi:hypothetical protein